MSPCQITPYVGIQGQGKEIVSVSTPYVGGARPRVRASTPYMGICGRVKEGVRRRSMKEEEEVEGVRRRK